jgi:hypothetical protein
VKPFSKTSLPTPLGDERIAVKSTRMSGLAVTSCRVKIILK